MEAAADKKTKRGLRNKRKKTSRMPSSNGSRTTTTTTTTTTRNRSGLQQSFPTEKFRPTTAAGRTTIRTAPSASARGAVASGTAGPHGLIAAANQTGLRQSFPLEKFHPTTATASRTAPRAPRVVASAPILFEDEHLVEPGGAEEASGVPNRSVDSTDNTEKDIEDNPQAEGEDPKQGEVESDPEQGDIAGKEGTPLLQATLVSTDSNMNLSVPSPPQEVYIAQPTPTDEKAPGFVLQRWVPNSLPAALCCLGFGIIAAALILTGILCGSGMCSSSINNNNNVGSQNNGNGKINLNTPEPSTSPPTFLKESTSIPTSPPSRMEPTHHTPSLFPSSLANNITSNIFEHSSASGTSFPSTTNGSNNDAISGDNTTAASTFLSTISPTIVSMDPPTCDNAFIFEFYLLTDGHPEDISWQLTNDCSGSGTSFGGEVVMSGPPEGDTYEPFTQYVFHACVDNDKEYGFLILDAQEDGICCENGNGSFNVFLGGQEILQGGDYTTRPGKRFGTCARPRISREYNLEDFQILFSVQSITVDNELMEIGSAANVEAGASVNLTVQYSVIGGNDVLLSCLHYVLRMAGISETVFNNCGFYFANPSPIPFFGEVTIVFDAPETPRSYFVGLNNAMSASCADANQYFDEMGWGPGHNFPNAILEVIVQPRAPSATPSKLPTLAPTFSLTPSSSLAPTESPAPSSSSAPSHTLAPSSSSAPSLAPLICDSASSLFEFHLLTDGHPEDISWRLTNDCSGTGVSYWGEVVMSGPPEGDTYEPFTQYVFQACVDNEKQYSVVIVDEQGDGVCCENGNGSIKVILGGQEILQGGDYTTSAGKLFGTCAQPRISRDYNLEDFQILFSVQSITVDNELIEIGSAANVEAGASVNLTVQYSVVGGNGGLCPGCIVQYALRMAGSYSEPDVFNNCGFYFNNPPPTGHSGEVTIVFDAPETPRSYFVGLNNAMSASCADANQYFDEMGWGPGHNFPNAILEVIVQPRAPSATSSRLPSLAPSEPISSRFLREHVHGIGGLG